MMKKVEISANFIDLSKENFKKIIKNIKIKELFKIPLFLFKHIQKYFLKPF